VAALLATYDGARARGCVTPLDANSGDDNLTFYASSAEEDVRIDYCWRFLSLPKPRSAATIPAWAPPVSAGGDHGSSALSPLPYTPASTGEMSLRNLSRRVFEPDETARARPCSRRTLRAAHSRGRAVRVRERGQIAPHTNGQRQKRW
jgi:hypothetical protein